MTEDVPETLNSDQALAIGIVVGACLKQESERQNVERATKIAMTNEERLEVELTEKIAAIREEITEHNEMIAWDVVVIVAFANRGLGPPCDGSVFLVERDTLSVVS